MPGRTGGSSTNPAQALNDNKRFAVVWSVLRALRSHDDRFDAEINQIDLNSKPTDRIIFGGGFGTSDGQSEGTDSAGAGTATLPFPPLDLPPAPSTPRSSRSAATASIGRAGPRMSRTSSPG